MLHVQRSQRSGLNTGLETGDPRISRKERKEQVASLCIAVHLILERLKGHHCSLCQQEGERLFSNVSCVSYKLRPAAGPHRNTFGALELPPTSASPGITPPPPSSPQGASGGSSSLQTSVSGDQRGRPCYACKLCQFLDCKYTFKSFKFVYCSLQITWIGFER